MNSDSRFRKIRRQCRLLAAAILLIAQVLTAITVYANPKPVPGTLYEKYHLYVDYNVKIIKKVISDGGGTLVKGIKLTSRDKAQFKKAEKRLKRGKYGERYAYKLGRTFTEEIRLLGFVDTLVGSKYRYLELRDIARSMRKPYHAYLGATKQNKKSLDGYTRNKKKMEKKLDALYKKEIAPYKSAGVSFRLAVALNLVANYFEYRESKKTNNLTLSIQTRQGVCADYSYMLDYFLKKMGIKSRLVSIKVREGYHMINALKIKGAWFYMDPTNTDAQSVAVVEYRGKGCFSKSIGGLYVSYSGWALRSVY